MEETDRETESQATLMQMWELLICPVCRDLFDNPKILPCVHSFCERCLEGVSEPDKETLQCPVCRVSTNLPTGGVADIPNNFFLNNILDIIKRHSATTTRDVLCHACSANVLSSLRCADCDVLLCTKCLQAHGVRTANHVLTAGNQATGPTKNNLETTKPLSGKPTTAQPITSSDHLATRELETPSDHPGTVSRHKLHIPLKCKYHPKQDLRYFCSSCAELTCTDCVIANHVTHIFVSASDAVPSSKAKLNTLLGQMTMRILFLSDAVREVKDTEGQLRKKFKDIQDMMVKTKNILLAKGFPKDRIHDDEKRIMIQLNAITGKKFEVLGKQRRKLETRLGLIESCRSFTSDLIMNGSDNELLMMENCIMESLGSLCQHTPEIPIECQEDSFIDFEKMPEERFRNGQGSHDEAVGTSLVRKISMKKTCFIELQLPVS